MNLTMGLSLRETADTTKRVSAPPTKVGGIKNYYVEMSLPMMKASVPYLRKLKV